MSISPRTLRAMRAAADWSVRDLAREAAVSPGTIVKLEAGGEVGPRIEARLRAALKPAGVWAEEKGGLTHIRISEGPAPEPSRRTANGLGALPYVSARPRKDGTFRVLFEVPARLRPEGWPAQRTLPLDRRRGDLSDPEEVARIKRDAKAMLTALEAARAQEGRFPAR